jgi:hypothetical protein
MSGALGRTLRAALGRARAIPSCVPVKEATTVALSPRRSAFINSVIGRNFNAGRGGGTGNSGNPQRRAADLQLRVFSGAPVAPSRKSRPLISTFPSSVSWRRRSFASSRRYPRRFPATVRLQPRPDR